MRRYPSRTKRQLSADGGYAPSEFMAEVSIVCSQIAKQCAKIDCYLPISVLVTNRTYQASYGACHAPRHEPQFRAAPRYARATAPDLPDAWPYRVVDRAGLA